MLFGIIALFAASAISYILQADVIALSLLSLGIVYLIVRRNYGAVLLMAFIELLVGSHGILLDVGPLSIRKLIFLTVGFTILGSVRSLGCIRSLIVPSLLLITWTAASAMRGVIDNGVTAAIDDVDGYAYLVFIPLAAWLLGQMKNVNIRRLILLATTAVSVVSLVVAFLFTHLPGDILDGLYTLLRDRRMYEITLRILGDVYWFRIFSPAMLFVAIGALIAWQDKASKLLGILGATILISESRTIFLAIVASTLILMVFEYRKVAEYLGTAMKAILIAVPIVALMFVPPRPDLTEAAFYKTSSDVGRSEAVVSRWDLLQEMNTEIIQNPFFGHGFGETVVYESADPRQNGNYETYRFEWGYQDIILKMGIVGLAFYLWLMGAIVKISIDRRSFLSLAIIILIAVSNVFSPYLNHPIGISGLLFALMIALQAPEQAESRSF